MDDPGNPDLDCAGQSTSVPKKSNNVGVIAAGSIIAGLLLIGMAIAVVCYLVDQRRQSNQSRELTPARPNFKLMRMSVTRPITSPYRAFFSPPAYSESSANLNASVHPSHLSADPTETQSSFTIDHSTIINGPGGHETPSVGNMDNPSPSLTVSRAAAQGCQDKKMATAKHDKQQLRLASMDT
jgi:HAMP domain-containing protein